VDHGIGHRTDEVRRHLDAVHLQQETRRGFNIVRTYADEGKSGLRIDGRQALQNLISDVVKDEAQITVA
ncbi:hypothetical protein C7270_25745, partial [Burkholderia thailandensis]|nr:hypothetical protein [Burkholderia thailandensis]